MLSREERAGEIDRLEWAPYSTEYGFYSPLMSGSIDGTDTRPHDRGVVRAMGVECEYFVQLLNTGAAGSQCCHLKNIFHV